MSLIYNGTEVKKLIYNGTEIKSATYNGTKVFSGETVYGWYKYNAEAVLSLRDDSSWSKTVGTNYITGYIYGGFSYTKSGSEWIVVPTATSYINNTEIPSSNDIDVYCTSYSTIRTIGYTLRLDLDSSGSAEPYHVKYEANTSNIYIYRSVAYITGYKQGSTNYGLVTSTSRSAYPDAGTPDNTYWYVYAGIQS